LRCYKKYLGVALCLHFDRLSAPLCAP